MRISFSSQQRLDCNSIDNVELNIECRDEMIPILAALQGIYSTPVLRKTILALVAADVNKTTRDDIGREGLSYWEILVLASVRLGCNLDYDKLQDLAENHRTLRHILGIGDWEQGENFSWRRIRDSVCLLSPETLAKINEVLVAHGQGVHGGARSRVRVDSFVIETNIHYPTESSLIWDGSRKVFEFARRLLEHISAPGWRQANHLRRRIKEKVRTIAQISASKSPKAKEALPEAYRQLLERVEQLLERARALISKAKAFARQFFGQVIIKQLTRWIELTVKVCGTAQRRLLEDETVPNDDKIFSLFEQHTQLYRRGKAGRPNQFGRLVLVFEDGAGFISHYKLLHRNEIDSQVVVAETRRVMDLHEGQIQSASFDRGFYSPENEQELNKIINAPCLPPRHPKQFAEKLKTASAEFRAARQRHPGVESAIGALQSGNGLKRCRDRSELGMERYIGLAILGRNLHTFGKLLIARQNSKAEAAFSKRKAI